MVVGGGGGGGEVDTFTRARARAVWKHQSVLLQLIGGYN